MPLVSISQEPILRFVGDDNLPLVGGQLFTYQAGTNNPYPTWTDSTGAVQHENPIILNSRGEVAYSTGVSAGLWVDPSVAYKYVLEDADGNEIWSLNNLQPYIAPLTQNGIATVLYPQNQAENAAGVTPSLFYINRYKDVPVERYGVDVSGGSGVDVTANTAAMNRAIAVAAAISNSGGVLYLPQGNIKVLADGLTAIGTNAINIQGSGKGSCAITAVGASLDQSILNYNGSTSNRIDSIFLRDFKLNSDNGLARGITASWVIGSKFENLYFYNLNTGWVGGASFDNSFTANNSFQCTQSTYILNTDCNSNSFYQCRMTGYRALSVPGFIDTLAMFGGDIEGVTSIMGVGGAGVYLGPMTGNKIYNANFYGVHFEHINGWALQVDGADSDSVNGLGVYGCRFFGDAAADPNPLANYAVRLFNVNGFAFEANDFGDWNNDAFEVNGIETNGRIQNNTSSGSVSGLSNLPFQGSVYVANNFSGPQQTFGPTNNFAPLYGTTVAIDRSLGQTFSINVANGTAFAISAPTNIFTGSTFTIIVRNVSGGSMGTITWDTAYKMSSWTNPASGTYRAITFNWTGTAADQVNQTGADISN